MKKSLVFALLVTTMVSGIAVAKNSDFCQAHLEKLLRGDKNLVGSQLENVNLKAFNLAGADLRNSDMEHARLQGANLSGVNFERADLEKANFQGANLSNVNFRMADLEEANLKGANIKGANFEDAELEYAIWVDGRVCAEGSVGGCW